MVPDAAHIRQLFLKHAQGTCTPDEAAMLVAYLQSEGNEEALPLPEEVLAAAPGNHVMEAGMAAQMLLHITGPVTPVRRRIITLRRVAVAAAVVALLAGIAWLLRPGRAVPEPPVTLSTGYGEIKRASLPDGSIITLNANTLVQYINRRNKEREVWIKGEAFFDIAPLAAGKFTVHAGKAVAVQVLGTRFSVATDEKNVQVVLNSGKVKVNLRHNNNISKALVLQPGEMAAYDSASGALNRAPADTLQLTGWRNNQFTFSRSSLGNIAKLIGKQFGVKVVFLKPELAALEFTGATPANDLDIMLAILEKSLDIKADEQSKQVVIKPAR